MCNIYTMKKDEKKSWLLRKTSKQWHSKPKYPLEIEVRLKRENLRTAARLKDTSCCLTEPSICPPKNHGPSTPGRCSPKNIRLQSVVNYICTNMLLHRRLTESEAKGKGKGKVEGEAEGRDVAMSVESIKHCERMTRRKLMVGVNDANISIRWILRAH